MNVINYDNVNVAILCYIIFDFMLYVHERARSPIQLYIYDYDCATFWHLTALLSFVEFFY